ncbi:hypothetical protein DAPPUDRAFT_116753 [Daphnia pulex]|uniref:Uncharacterized protein n=1 Tax=Daphnia pulex TaxID=6669 RepID=E9HQE0_DAPPU|nr:hypothetical protein DAPPUDRAFT_116753 [Daphnia pulex]|eukprot:EFX66040.1 hypothetical protein DAPPUDRAFT_116753 [Daphnia pulex]
MLTKQPENNDSVVGSSVSKSKASQRPDSAAIINEMQQHLHQETELRRSVEEQRLKATITMTQMTLDSVRICSEIERNAELQRKLQHQADQMAKEKRDSDEAELQYRTLVEKYKRETNEKQERAMEAVDTRIKQLEELSRQKKEVERSEKADAPGHGAIQKKRVDFSDHNTEVTAEGTKETDANGNIEYLIRRRIPNFSRDNPEAVNPNPNPVFFNSSSFDDLSLDDDDETNPGTSFFRSATPSFGTSHQDPSFSRYVLPSFGAQNHGTSFFQSAFIWRSE